MRSGRIIFNLPTLTVQYYLADQAGEVWQGLKLSKHKENPSPQNDTFQEIQCMHSVLPIYSGVQG